VRKLAVVAVLLACLAVSAWWTATPRTDQQAVGETAAIYDDSRANDRRVPWQTSSIVKDVGSGIGVVTLKSDLKRAGVFRGGQVYQSGPGLNVYAAEVSATPWLNKVPTTLTFPEGMPDVPIDRLKAGTRWLVRVPAGGNSVSQAMEVTGNTVHLPPASVRLVTDDLDGGDKATVALDKLKAKTKKR
jgi:hypothetical protein